MNHYRNISGQRGFQQPPAGGPGYPGISGPFAFGGGAPQDPGLFGGGSSPNLPAQYPGLTPQAGSGAGGGGGLAGLFGGGGGAGGAGGGFSLANVDFKGIIDRMGGIDGVLATVTKMQKVMSSVRQMAPMLKLLTNFGKKKGGAAVLGDDDDEWKPRRRRKRKRRSGTGGTGSARKRRRPRTRTRRR